METSSLGQYLATRLSSPSEVWVCDAPVGERTTNSGSCCKPTHRWPLQPTCWHAAGRGIAIKPSFFVLGAPENIQVGQRIAMPLDAIQAFNATKAT